MGVCVVVCAIVITQYGVVCVDGCCVVMLVLNTVCDEYDECAHYVAVYIVCVFVGCCMTHVFDCNNT